jgi:hypothetical protein
LDEEYKSWSSSLWSFSIPLIVYIWLRVQFHRLRSWLIRPFRFRSSLGTTNS